MSIRSLAALAVARDNADAGQPAGGGAAAAAVQQPDGTARGIPATGPPEKGGVPQGFTDVLVSAIPTEPLAAYTALVGVAVGALDLTRPHDYLPYRWSAYGVFLVVIVAAVWIAYYRASRGPAGLTDVARRRRFPLAEAASALLAGAAWGLVMPGSPLSADLTGTARTLTTASLIIGVAAVLSLVGAPQLKTGSKTGDAAPPDTVPSGAPPAPATANGVAPQEDGSTGRIGSSTHPGG